MEGIEKDLDAYIKDHYKNGNSAVYFTGGDDALKVIVCIESHAFSPNNFWNGILLSEYTVDMKSKKLKGKISVHVRVFRRRSTILRTGTCSCSLAKMLTRI